MNLKEAVDEVVLRRYPKYNGQIRVVNNTIRLDLAFKDKNNAEKFINVLYTCLRQRYDKTIIVFYQYIDNPFVINDRVVFGIPHRAPQINDCCISSRHS